MKTKKLPLIMVGVIVLLFLVFRFPYTGYVMREELTTYVDVLDKTFTEDGKLVWEPEHNGEIVKVSLSGVFSGQGGVKVYLVDDKEYLLINGTRSEEDYKVTLKARKEENATLDVVLRYNEGTSWDINDDGIESEDNVIDFNVGNSNTGYNDSELCTRWETHSIKEGKSTFLCYGAERCCDVIGLSPSSENWNDIFNTFVGRLGANYKNIIRAQLISVSDGIEKSGWGSLKAVFAPNIIFIDECVETCSAGLDKKEFEMRVEIEDGEFILSNISYVVKSLEKNSPPELVKDIKNITTRKNKDVVIDLKAYFNDANDDVLDYSLVSIGSKFNNENGLFRISPKKGYIGDSGFVIEANDGYEKIISNEFIISYYDFPDTTVETLSAGNLPGSVGEEIKFVRKINITNNIGGRSIRIVSVIPSVAENIFVEGLGVEGVENSDYVEGESFDAVEFDKNKEKRGVKSKKVYFEVYLEEDEGKIFEMVYFMPGAVASEEIVEEYSKKVIVDSEFNYQNITVEVEIPIEAPGKNIRIYWVNEKELVEDIEYIDTNNNGLIDRVSWVVPHLSEQEFDIIIDLVTIEFDSSANRELEIAFTTLIDGNLSIEAVRGTKFAEEEIDDLDTKDDVNIKELICGNNSLYGEGYSDPSLSFVYDDELIPGSSVFDETFDIDKMFVENYSCDTTSYFTADLLKDKKHKIEFEFNGQTVLVETDEYVEAPNCAEHGCLYIKDDCGCNRAVFNGAGSLFINGEQEDFEDPDGNDFVIESGDGDVVFWIDDITGNLYLNGSVFKKVKTLYPAGNDDFIIQNRDGNVTAYVDGGTGNLFLKGKLNEEYFDECSC